MFRNNEELKEAYEILEKNCGKPWQVFQPFKIVNTILDHHFRHAF